MKQTFDKKIKVGEHEYSVHWNVSDMQGFNCAIRQLHDLRIVAVGHRRLVKEEWYAVLDSKEFDDLITTNSKQPCAFCLCTGLNSNYHEDPAPEEIEQTKGGMYPVLPGSIQATTRDVIAAITRSKRGAWVCTPIYDNTGHAFPDSLQVFIIWWPAGKMECIVNDRPYWHIPKQPGKLEKMVKRWSQREGKNYYSKPKNLFEAVKMVLTNTGLKRANPVPAPTPKVVEKKEEAPLEWAS